MTEAARLHYFMPKSATPVCSSKRVEGGTLGTQDIKEFKKLYEHEHESDDWCCRKCVATLKRVRAL